MTDEMGVAFDLMRLEGICKLASSPRPILWRYVPTIGKSSVENAIKRLIEEGVLVKHGSGRSVYYTRRCGIRHRLFHDRRYHASGRLPRKFPN